MGYFEQMQAILYNPIGMYDRDLCIFYFNKYSQEDLKKKYISLLYTYA